MKKVVVIDSLTETFNGPIVRSGLQKSAKLDARAFAKMGYDTTFLYCGVIDDHYPYKKICLNDIGAKEDVARHGKHMRASGNYVKSYLNRSSNMLLEADYIVAHCHSVGMMTGINAMVKDKKILFIIHDVIDLTWACGFTNAVNNMRATGRNYTHIATNSQYSIARLDYIYSRAKDRFELLSGNEAFDSFIRHFVWSDVNPTREEIIQHEKKSAVVGRYEPAKYHHKLYKYKNAENTIVHYGIKDPRRDEGLKYYENLKIKANAYSENLSDEDLWESIKTSQSIILPCYHEGFGFTAFEAGIFGVAPVILVHDQGLHKGQHAHATVQYLTRAGTKHFTADFNDEESIIRAINDSLQITEQDRIDISSSLLSYFTVENYVNERIELLESAKKTNIESSLESFFE